MSKLTDLHKRIIEVRKRFVEASETLKKAGYKRSTIAIMLFIISPVLVIWNAVYYWLIRKFPKTYNLQSSNKGLRILAKSTLDAKSKNNDTYAMFNLLGPQKMETEMLNVLANHKAIQNGTASPDFISSVINAINDSDLKNAHLYCEIIFNGITAKNVLERKTHDPERTARHLKNMDFVYSSWNNTTELFNSDRKNYHTRGDFMNIILDHIEHIFIVASELPPETPVDWVMEIMTTGKMSNKD